MPRLNQKGVIAQLLILLLLGVGLAVGIYLVQQKTNIFSRASVSKPIGPETSFTLSGASVCVDGWRCIPEFLRPPQKEEEFVVKLFVRSDLETANLFTAKMNFPADLVEVEEIKTDDGFIKNWMENHFDNNSGIISLTGGVPDPGYQTQVGGESALMATIVFRAKSIGKGTVDFSDTSAIYSNLNNIDILTIKRPYDISVEVKPVPTPTLPKPACQPRPACLDSKPACLLAEPAGGYCPTTSPVITPKPACQPRPACLDSKPACKMPEPEGGWCFKNSGDVNSDGKTNLIDMSKLLAQFNKSGSSMMADMNGDEKINVVDILLLRNILVKNGVLIKQ